MGAAASTVNVDDLKSRLATAQLGTCSAAGKAAIEKARPGVEVTI